MEHAHTASEPSSPHKEQLVAMLHSLSQLSGGVVIALALLALLGWMLSIDFFKSLVPGLIAMNPTTAVCFVAAGSALLLRHLFRSSAALTLLAQALSLLIIAIGIIKLLDVFTLWDPGIDHVLHVFANHPDTRNHIAPFSAVNFIATGIGLLWFDREIAHRHSPAQFLGLFVVITSFLILIGYAFSLLSFHMATAHFITMPLNTALTFVILGLGLLHICPDRGLIRIITADFLGSYMLRRLLPVAIGLPILLGWLRVAGQNAGWFSLQVGATLYTTATIAIISALIWYVAVSLNRADRRRHTAEEALRQTNRHLLQTNRALKEANDLKMDLLHIAAHDMKNPLGAIRTMTEIIRSYPDDRDTVHEMIGLIYSSSNQMLGLIDELLRTAALDSGTIELHCDYVDLHTLLAIVTDANRPQAQRKHQHLLLTATPGCVVEGDFARLREVFDNLVSNAVKYSPEETTVYITLERLAETARIGVRDEGPGLTEEDKKKLFGKFQRLHARPTGGESSTGLGLSIAKQLVELHHGTIWAESEGENRGTTFYVELPLAPSAPALADAEHDGNSVV